MLIRRRGAWLLPASLASLLAIAIAHAAPSAPSAAPPAPSASASARASASAVASNAPLPPGHPTLAPDDGDDDDEDAQPLPAGHPATGARPANGPPQAETHEDPTLPRGTIVVQANDEQGRPLPGANVILGILQNSVAKGENREKRPCTADAQGICRFDGLEVASGTAYRTSIVKDGATYAAMPFNLSQKVGTRATIPVFPVTNDAARANIQGQGILYIEVKDEVFQLEQAYRLFNVSAVTWLPENVITTLPEGWKALSSQQAMSDIGWDAAPKSGGVRFHGTIAPGRHDTAFRYQVPNDGVEDVTLDVGLPPGILNFRVIADAAKGMALDVDGFPPAQSANNGNGQRVLVTERQTERVDPGFRKVRIHLRGLPTKSSGRWVAVVIAALAAAFGLALTVRKTPPVPDDPKELAEARERLLEELTGLERAKVAGEVGPKTYEHARSKLLDALARVLAREEALPKVGKRKKKKG